VKDANIAQKLGSGSGSGKKMAVELDGVFRGMIINKIKL
jgi:hypothetical protein